MSRRPLPLAAPLAALALFSSPALIAPQPARADWPNNSDLNLPIAVQTNNQSEVTMCSDGAGGAFLAWSDGRSGGLDIYAQHVLASGVADPVWPAQGLDICSAAGTQHAPSIATDGAGGFFVAWQDLRNADDDIYALHVHGDGSLAGGWPANGLAVIFSSGTDHTPISISDGAGGCYVGWIHDYSLTDHDPYVEHINGDGSVPAGWNPGIGLDIDLDVHTQEGLQLCLDNAGGVYAAYTTNQSGNFDIRVQRYTASGVQVFNVLATNAANDQVSPLVTGDGFGGVFVTWEDKQSDPNGDAYMARLSASGSPPAGWSGTIPLGALASTSEFPTDIVADGTGGCYVAWAQLSIVTYYVRVAHVVAGGYVPAGWPLTTYHTTDVNAKLANDGEGGVVVAFTCYSFGGSGRLVVAQRFTSAATIGPNWPAQDLVVSSAPGIKNGEQLIADGKGGFITAWSDLRNSLGYDVYAQRFERFGELGNPEPKIAGVKDVPNDQGGEVRLSWNASYLDAQPYPQVYDYRVWRQAPALAAQAALASGAATLESAAPTSSTARAAGARKIYRVTRDAAQSYYWEQIASVPAATQTGYSLVAATTGDSIAGSNPSTAFMVDAVNYGSIYWSSAPDSGYSADNLPPVAPSPFDANFTGSGGTYLNWGPNAETDLAGYRLYKDADPNFTPSPSNRVYQGALPSYHDGGTHLSEFKVCAYDIHGNEGPCTAVLPAAGTTDASPEIPTVLAFAPASANPSRGAAALRLALPHGARVSLAIYDAQGREVVTLASGLRDAGVHLVRWDGRDERGAETGAGVYFARARVDERTLIVRLVRTP